MFTFFHKDNKNENINRHRSIWAHSLFKISEMGCDKHSRN